METLVNILAWIAVLVLVGVTVMLAMNKQSGLKMIQHRADMLPQAMLVRYAALTILALVSAWIGAPRVLFAMLLALAVIGFGDAYIYRRAGYPHLLHLIIGCVTALGALLSLFAM